MNHIKSSHLLKHFPFLLLTQKDISARAAANLHFRDFLEKLF